MCGTAGTAGRSAVQEITKKSEDEHRCLLARPHCASEAHRKRFSALLVHYAALFEPRSFHSGCIRMHTGCSASSGDNPGRSNARLFRTTLRRHRRGRGKQRAGIRLFWGTNLPRASHFREKGNRNVENSEDRIPNPCGVQA